MSKPKVTYYFRKPTASFHSIEVLFETVIKYLRKSTAEKIVLPYRLNEGPLAMLKNCYYARSRQGQVNHITGEIYYIAAALIKKHTILTIHDIESLVSNNKFKDLLLQFFWLYLPARQVRYITVVSEHSKRMLLKATGIASEKVFVIPNCVSFTKADFAPKLDINKEKPVLLQIGTKQNKNLDNLVLALKGMPCKLLILGKLSHEQISLLESNQIEYENYTDLYYAEVKALYYRTDIVSFVSTFEGFGMPILEANALGRPVITSTTTSMPEVAGEGALLVDPSKPDELRDAINKLVTDDEFRSKLVAAGYKNSLRFKPEVVAGMYEDLYERVIKESR